MTWIYKLLCTFFTYRHIHNTTHRCYLVFTDVLISCISVVKKEKYQVIYIKIHLLTLPHQDEVSNYVGPLLEIFFFFNEDYSINLFLDGDKMSVTLSKQVPLHTKQWKELTYCNCFPDLHGILTNSEGKTVLRDAKKSWYQFKGKKNYSLLGCYSYCFVTHFTDD